nr:hypothetical protein [Methylosinus sp. PW1]
MNGDNDPLLIDGQIETIGAELHRICHPAIHPSNYLRAGSASCFVGEIASKRLSHDEKSVFRVAPLRSAGKAGDEAGCDEDESADAPSQRAQFVATGAHGVSLLCDSMRIPRRKLYRARAQR